MQCTITVVHYNSITKDKKTENIIRTANNNQKQTRT
ncbi:hypothetical protein EVA_06476 [gut metagenome]|uniref:Uncharacterized protein n=1 Tax=gut metagenome TaxID=749906 RepID=J9GS39_9ZZZZ